MKRPVEIAVEVVVGFVTFALGLLVVSVTLVLLAWPVAKLMLWLDGML